jgi:SPP1 family predicted phage head-tail adaptor
MRAGPLRHRLTIDEKIETQASDGHLDPTWNPIGTFYGSIEPARGREFYNGDQIRDDVDTTIRMRYSIRIAELTPRHRIRHQGVIYNVVTVLPDATQRRMFRVMCKSGTNDG